MIKPLPQKKQKTGKKWGKILTFVFGVLTLVGLAGIIAFATTKPSDQRIQSKTVVKSISEAGERWLYTTTDGNLNLCNNANEVLDTTNVIDYVIENAEDKNRSAYSLSTIDYGDSSKNIYAVVTYTSDKTTDYVVRYETDSEQMKLVNPNDYIHLETKLSRITDDGTYTYFITSAPDSGNFRCVSRYNTHNIKNGLIKDKSGHERGYLLEITYYDEIEEIIDVETISFATTPIVSFDYYNNYLYVTYSNGVLVFPSDDYSLNFKQREGTVSIGNWDFKKYNSFMPDGIEIKGAALTDGEFLCSTSQSYLSHFNIVDLPETPDYVPFIRYKDFKLPTITSTRGNALIYNPYTKKAVVVYDQASTVTLVDFSNINKPIPIFSDAANINISNVVQTSNGEQLIYLYKNSEESGSNIDLLSTKYVNSIEYKFLAEKLIVVSVVLFIVFAILFTIALLIWIKKLFLEKFINFLMNIRKHWVTYAILGACLVLLFMFCYYPAAGSISMSFFHYKTGEPVTFNFFRNYAQIFTDTQVLGAFGNMIGFLAADIITALIPPLIFAFFLTIMRGKKFSALTRTLLFLPAVIPGVTKMMIWQTGIYGQYGLVNLIIKACNGQPIAFFNGGGFDFWALILMGFPYVGSYLVFYGALMNVPSSYYEAAELEGMGVWRRFTRIDIPLIRPQIKYVFVLTFIASVQNFGRTYMITSSDFTLRTPIHLMYDAIQRGDYGYSSAMATILFILLFVATLFNMRKQKEKMGDAI